MEKVDVLSFGWWYEIILVMLSAVVVVDAVSIIKVLSSGDGEERREYAQLCIKYLKILMCVMAGVFFITVAACYGYDYVTSLIHGILGGLLILDSLVCFIIKIKYGRKHK